MNHRPLTPLSLQSLSAVIALLALFVATVPSSAVAPQTSLFANTVLTDISRPSIVLSPDFDGNGVPDLAVLSESAVDASHRVLIYLGNGDSTFVSRPPLTLATNQTVVMTSADFNGDSRPDLAVTDRVSNAPIVTIYLNRGDGTFDAPVQTPIDRLPVAITTGD